jgi:hypothetical protein
MDGQCLSCGDIINAADIKEAHHNVCGSCERDFAETAADPMLSGPALAPVYGHGDDDDIPF